MAEQDPARLCLPRSPGDHSKNSLPGCKSASQAQPNTRPSCQYQHQTMLPVLGTNYSSSILWEDNLHHAPRQTPRPGAILLSQASRFSCRAQLNNGLLPTAKPSQEMKSPERLSKLGRSLPGFPRIAAELLEAGTKQRGSADGTRNEGAWIC